MELRILDAAQVREIYENHMVNDFPEDELRPLDSFLQSLGRGFYDCLGLFEDETLRAYGFFARNDARGYLLLDFFAVCSQYRNGGYGGRFLQLVKEYYRDANGILLECETERTAKDEADRKLRRRRIDFYVRNGCRETNVYTILSGVEFDLLYLPIRNEEPQLTAEMKRLYLVLFGEEKCRKHTTVSLR